MNKEEIEKLVDEFKYNDFMERTGVGEIAANYDSNIFNFFLFLNNKGLLLSGDIEDNYQKYKNDIKDIKKEIDIYSENLEEQVLSFGKELINKIAKNQMNKTTKDIIKEAEENKWCDEDYLSFDISEFPESEINEEEMQRYIKDLVEVLANKDKILGENVISQLRGYYKDKAREELADTSFEIKEIAYDYIGEELDRCLQYFEKKLATKLNSMKRANIYNKLKNVQKIKIIGISEIDES